ncbi:MAG: hypothetical protein JNG86_13970, partial [Verrucomicrobiaceae bacterium]|nr:hypothetical protein [Verrucomicrobiaceae bacterium]
MNAELDLLSHTALKGTAVLLAALLAGVALRRLAASQRYAVWMMAMVVLAVLPFATLSLPAWRVIPKDTPPPDWMVLEPMVAFEPVEEASMGSKQDGGVAKMPSTTAAGTTPAPQPAKPVLTWEEMVAVLLNVWLCVALVMLARLLWSAARLRRLQRKLEPGVCAELGEVAREIGLSKAPQLLIGPAGAVPMVWGVFRPRLLLPCGFESWSTAKRRGVLLHELAHLRRGDPLALWLAQGVKALHWFNPLAWLTVRQMRADQERACDDTVLRHGITPSDYAQSLLDLSRHSRVAPGLALCALTITCGSHVESRVRAVLDAKCSRAPLTLRWLAAVAAVALLLMLPVAMLHAIDSPKLRGRILDRHGVVLAETTKEKSRHYPLKSLAAHLIGYAGKTKWDNPTPKGYIEIEKSHNDTLVRGDDVRLTLDARLQSFTHRAMLDAGYERGAAVVLDPRSGEILAAVSVPAYDLNVFIPTVSHDAFESITKDRDAPLLNRCAGEFPAGSAFTPLTALAGIAAGVSGQPFTCDGSIRYGSIEMQCWIKGQSDGRHGSLDMPQAMVRSCNCFWYQFGNAAGGDRIEAMAAKIGFGSRFGVFDREGEGFVPGPSRAKAGNNARVWRSGDTANFAIGQGQLLVTPLQMAVLAATVANGGLVPQPTVLSTERKNGWRADLTAEGLPAAEIAKLREGMRLVVHDEKGIGKA